MGKTWEAASRKVIAFLLKFAALFFLGVGFQRAAFAISAGVPGLADVSRADTGGRPILLASQENAVVGMPEITGSGFSMPQGTGHEAISQERTSAFRQRRRKPRMAGVPDGGLKMPLPEQSNFATLQADGQGGAQGGQAKSAQQADAGRASVPDQEDGGGDEETSSSAPVRSASTTSPFAKLQQERKFSLAPTYRMAPIKWYGTVTELVGRKRTANPGTQNSGVTETMQMYGLSVGASTYVLEKWVATLRGQLGITGGSNSFLLSDAESRTRHSDLTGFAEASLFSRSRFPFLFQYMKRSSRAEAIAGSLKLGLGQSSREQKTSRLLMNQKYTPLNGAYDTEGTFERVSTNYIGLGSATGTRLMGTYNTHLWGFQPFDAQAELTKSVATSGEVTNTQTAMASHSYLPPDSLLSIYNKMNYWKTRSPTLASMNFLLNSGGNWQPEAEDVPLVVTGNVYYSLTKTGLAVQSKGQRLGMALGATYSAFQPVFLSGGATLVRVRSGSLSSWYATQYAKAAYRPGTIRLGKDNSISYTRSASAGISNAMSSQSRAVLSLSGNASHSVTAPFSFALFGRPSSVRTSGSQTFTFDWSRSKGMGGSLTHLGTVAWSPFSQAVRLPGVGGSSQLAKIKARWKSKGLGAVFSSIGVQMQDTRNFGVRRGSQQYVRLFAQAAGKGDYDGKATASGYGVDADISVVASRQTTGAMGAAAIASARGLWSTTYAYNYRYTNGKVFGVRGLNYSLGLGASFNPKLADQRRQEILFGQAKNLSGLGAGYGLDPKYATGIYTPFGMYFTQDMKYRIGKNEWVFSASLKDDYGRKQSSVFMTFRAWRNFGN